MERLTDLLGRRVTTASGRELGRLQDLVIGLGAGDEHPKVRAAVTRNDHERSIDWNLVRAEPGRLIFDEPIETRADELADDELLLRRDVLDVQVVDLAGHRIARVGDVVLTDDLVHPEIAALEIGFAPVLDRMGLHRTSTRADRRIVDWHEVHLTSERGHDVQLDMPRSAIHLLDAEALAALLHRLDTESASETVTALDAAISAHALEHAHASTTERILRSLPRHRASDLVGHMSDPSAERWRRRLAHPRPLAGRRFFRTSGWRRHHRHEAR